MKFVEFKGIVVCLCGFLVVYRFDCISKFVYVAFVVSVVCEIVSQVVVFFFGLSSGLSRGWLSTLLFSGENYGFLRFCFRILFLLLMAVLIYFDRSMCLFSWCR